MNRRSFLAALAAAATAPAIVRALPPIPCAPSTAPARLVSIDEIVIATLRARIPRLVENVTAPSPLFRHVIQKAIPHE